MKRTRVEVLTADGWKVASRHRSRNAARAAAGQHKRPARTVCEADGRVLWPPGDRDADLIRRQFESGQPWPAHVELIAELRKLYR